MPSTRSGRSHNTSPAQASTPANKKRKADASSPSAQASKRGKPAKDQKTIEETLDVETVNKDDSTEPSKSEQTNGASTNGHADAPSNANDKHKDDSKPPTIENGTNGTSVSKQETKPEEKEDVEMTDGDAADKQESSTANETSKEQPAATQEKDVSQPPAANEEKDASQPPAATKEKKVETTEDKQSEPNGHASSKDAVQTDQKREQAMPSNILEKGIIYFFTRGRVGIDEPESVQDLQRSYFVLRPMPAGGKLTDGSIQESNSNRLFALPKKVWPKSGKDRFMVFVEKAKTNMANLKEEFFQGSEYTTQTSGVRHTPPVSAVGEGVYAITTTGGGQGTTHLVYMLTVPSSPGEVQSDVGISEKGSFVLSLKNPESSGPSYAQLPEKPDFPKDFIDEFRGRGWMPVHPKHLDYPNAQLLIIGEDFESSKNLELKPKDEQDSTKETPEQELQKLEEEDEHRVEALKGDDTIFDDLGISKKEYGILTTW